MAHLLQTAKSFGDNFTSTFQQSRRLAQRESEVVRREDFQNRQLSLREAFRRDQLDVTIERNQMLSTYYENLDENADERTAAEIQRNKNQLFINDIFPANEDTPADARTFQAYGKTYVVPEDPVLRSTFGRIGGKDSPYFGETQFKDNRIVGFDNVGQPTVSRSSPSDTFNALYNAGISQLTKLKSLVSKGFGDSNQYNEAKQKGTLSVYQALDKVGIQKDVLEGLRKTIEGIGSDDSDERERLLNLAIDELNKKYILTDEQLMALKLWKDIGIQ